MCLEYLNQMKKPSKTIDSYIETFPSETQVVLKKLRKIIKKEMPDAEEVISYQIPSFKLNGTYVIYFAGWKQHVSLYPLPKGNATLQKEIAPYIAGRGTLKFSLDKPIPYSLIQRVIQYKVKESKKK